MNPFLHLTLKRRKDEPDKQAALVAIQEPPHNTSEGSEFLDDAIRFKDQPLIFTKVSVTAGSPEYFL